MTRPDGNKNKISNASQNNEKMCLIYDGACPVCCHFAEKYSSASDRIALVNAREKSVELTQATSRGFNLDQGLVFIVGNNYSFAEDALHQLANEQSMPGLFGFFFNRIFRYLTVSRLTYPLLTLLRRVLLKLLGVKQINKMS